MNPLKVVTRAFIDVFGITHPTPEQERRATWFISILLGLIVLALGSVLAALTIYARK